ncbi:MAG: hypothetical protein M0036_08835 [Desulfobacteraceae bacterium]|nr:hypothetical protein [Desulfobacteraceae bacterium]
MNEENHDEPGGEVDKSLVAMFIKMLPEERLRANDRAASAIMELRNAFSKKIRQK